MSATAEELPYAGATIGPATTSANSPFDSTGGAYIFLGLQTDYYATYEIGISHFETDTAPGEFKKGVLNQLTVSALGHLPISDSSLFVRLGLSGYQYRDNKDELRDIIVPTVGAGIDYGIKPRVTIRLEWQRYMDLEYNSSKFDIETTRLGFLVYF